MIVVTYLLRQSITLYKNLGRLEQNLGGLEPLSPIASAATGHRKSHGFWTSSYRSPILPNITWLKFAPMASAYVSVVCVCVCMCMHVFQ